MAANPGQKVMEYKKCLLLNTNMMIVTRHCQQKNPSDGPMFCLTEKDPASPKRYTNTQS